MTKFQSALLAGVTLLGLATFSTEASAVTMKAVYDGTISYSSLNSDKTGLFGAGAGTSVLDGLSYSLTYLFDTAAPNTIKILDPDQETIQGGPRYGTSNGPISSVSITINGHTEIFSPDYAGLVSNAPDVLTQHLATEYSDDGVLYKYHYFNSYIFGLGPKSLDSAFTMAGDGCDICSNFWIVDYDYSTKTYTKYVRGLLTPDKVTVSRVAAVPLPAALPLLAASIATLGILGRRKKNAISKASARQRR